MKRGKRKEFGGFGGEPKELRAARFEGLAEWTKELRLQEREA